MEQIWLVIGAVAVYFGAVGIRGLFGWMKNNKIAIGDVKFDWKKFINGSLTPVVTTISFGVLAGIVLLFLQIVAKSGIQVAGIDQVSIQTILVGLFIADVGAIGYAVREALLVIGLSDKQIDSIRDTASKTTAGEKLGVEIKNDNGDITAFAVNVKQDAGDGAELGAVELAQMGAFPYYAVDVSSAQAFVNAVNGKGFDEGYGMQCVAAFKEHQFAQAGRIVATSNGGANGYANQRAQIEALGYTYHNDGQLQDGDWVIFGGSQYGHVAMYFQGRWFSQNQAAANPNVGNPFGFINNVGLPYLCHYRPNQLIVVTPPAPTPEPAPQPNGDIVVGATVTPTRAVSYDGVELADFVLQGQYPVIEVSGDRAVLGNGLNTAFHTGDLKVVAGEAPVPAPQPPEVGIGTHVTTNAVFDSQNGLKLNLDIINDGQSVFAEVNSNGFAVLEKDGVVRAAVPVESLSAV